MEDRIGIRWKSLAEVRGIAGGYQLARCQGVVVGARKPSHNF